jgi:hypothetical protein
MLTESKKTCEHLRLPSSLQSVTMVSNVAWGEMMCVSNVLPDEQKVDRHHGLSIYIMVSF